MTFVYQLISHAGRHRALLVKGAKVQSHRPYAITHHLNTLSAQRPCIAKAHALKAKQSLALVSVAHYHNVEYSGGGVMGRDGYGPQGPPGAQSPSAEPLAHLEPTRLRDPRTIVKHLNDYVVGQERAKKILAVAVFNHYSRVRANISRQQQQTKEREREGFPFQPDCEERHHAEHHHPTLPQEYYPTSPIQSGELVPAERTGSFSTQRRAWLNPPSQNSAGPLSGEVTGATAVSQDDVSDNMAVHEKSNVLLLGPTGSGKTLLARTLAQILRVPFSMSDATPFTQAGYVGEDVETVIQRLLQACDYDVKKAETGIVFIDEIDKISRRSDSQSSARDVSGEGVQQSLLRMLEGTVVTVTDKSGAGGGQGKRGGAPGSGNGSLGSPSKGETYAVDTSNILFILSGAFIGLEKTVMDRIAKGSIGFGATIKSSSSDELTNGREVRTSSDVRQALDLVEPADLVKYGLIPEFVGRLPVLANVNNLTVGDLVRVLTEPKNSLLKQYEGLFRTSQVELRFSQKALHAIAKLALEKKTGARGLRRIMETLLLDPMYDAPGSYIRQVVIDSQVVAKEKMPIYLGGDQTELADTILAQDDDAQTHPRPRSVVENIHESVRQQMTQA